MGFYQIRFHQFLDMVADGGLGKVQKGNNGTALQFLVTGLDGLQDFETVDITQGLGYFFNAFKVQNRSTYIDRCKCIDKSTMHLYSLPMIFP